MKHLYNKFVENFLFEQRFLNVIRNPEAARSAITIAPHDKAEVPTIDDVKDRIQLIRDNLHKVKGGIGNKKRDVLNKHLIKLEKKMKKLDESISPRQAKQKIIDDTYKQLEQLMVQHGIKEKEKLNLKELPPNIPPSLAEAARNNISIIEDFLESSVDKDLKYGVPPYKTKASKAYKEIVGGIAKARAEMKKVDTTVDAPKKYINAFKNARDDYRDVLKTKPKDFAKIDKTRDAYAKAEILMNQEKYKAKEKEYQKINDKLILLAKDYDIKLEKKYKAPKVKDVVSKVKKLADQLPKIKDPQAREMLKNNLKLKIKIIGRIMNSRMTPEQKQKLVAQEYRDVSAMFIDHGLEKVPGIRIEKRISRKIVILQNFLNEQRGIWSHSIAMKANKEYRTAYNKIQYAKKNFEKALLEKNPIIRKFMLMQIDKKLDDGFQSQMKKEKADDPKDKRLWLPENLKHEKAQVFEHLSDLPDVQAIDHVLSFLETQLSLLKPYMKKIETNLTAKKIVNDLIKGVKESRKQYEALLKENDPKKKQKGFAELKTKITRIVRDATLPVKIPKLTLAKAKEALKNLTQEQIADHKMKYLKVSYEKNKERIPQDNKALVESIVKGLENDYSNAKAETNKVAREKKFKKLNAKIDNIVRMANQRLKGKFAITIPPLNGVSVGPKQAATPSAKTKPGERVPDPAKIKLSEIKSESMRNLVKDLMDFESGKTGNYQYALDRVKLAVQIMGLDAGPTVNKIITHKLKGGYKVATLNWPKIQSKNMSNETMVNMVIYNAKGDILCVREGGTWMSPDRSPHVRRISELVKANSVVNNLSNSLARIQTGEKPAVTDKVKFLNQQSLKQFKDSLISLTKSMRFKTPPKNKLIISQKGLKVYYTSTGPGNGEFRIDVENPKHLTLFFDSSTGKLGEATIINDKGKPKIKSKGYESEMDSMTLEEQAKIKKVKEIKEKKRKAQEDRKRTEGMIGDKFKKAFGFYKFQNATNGNEFTITGTEKSHPKLINKPIHELINFNKYGKNLVYLTIKGAKGKPDRQAVYIPGQRGKDKTALLLDKNGKLTKKRVSFYPGDTITIQTKTASSANVQSLNMPKYMQKRLETVKNNLSVREVKYKIDQFNSESVRLYKALKNHPFAGSHAESAYKMSKDLVKESNANLKKAEKESNSKKRQAMLKKINDKIDKAIKVGNKKLKILNESIKIKPYKEK